MASELGIRFRLIGDAASLVQAINASEVRFTEAAADMVAKAKKLNLFEQVDKSAKETAKTYQQLNDELEAMTASASAAGLPAAQASPAFSALRAEVVRVEAAMQSEQKAAATLQAELSTLGIDARNASGEFAKLGTQIRGLTATPSTVDARRMLGIRSNAEISQEILGIQKAMETLKKSDITQFELTRAAEASKVKLQALKDELRGIPAQAETASSSYARLSKTVLALGAAYFALVPAINAVKKIVEVAAAFEQLEIRMKSVMGSAEAGQRAFAWIKDFAAKTPFQVTEIADAFTRLKNFGIDPTNGSMQAITDLSAKLGGGMETLSGITLAVGQAWAKGKLQGEEIMQLVERGVPVWDLLGKVTGKTASELSTLSQNGQLGRDVIKKLLDEMERSSLGASADQMSTWNGMVSNATDLWNEFLDAIGKAGLLDVLKQELTAITAEFQRMKDSGELQVWAEKIGNAIAGLIKLLEGLVKAVVVVAGASENMLPVLASLGAGFGALKLIEHVKNMTVMASAMKAVGIAAGETGMMTAIAARASALYGTAIAAWPLVLVAAGVAGVAMALKPMADRAIEAQREINKLTDEYIRLNHELDKNSFGGAIVSNDQFKGMTDSTLTEYIRGLKAQRDLYVNEMKEASLKDDDKAFAAANAERARYAQALRDVDAYQHSRIQMEAQYNSSIEAIRKGMLTDLEQTLAAEKKQLEKANQQLNDATQARKQAADRWKSISADLTSGGGKSADELNILDIQEQVSKARAVAAAVRQNASDSNINNARQQFDALAKMIKDANSAGKIGADILNEYAKEAAKLDDQVGAAQEKNAKDQVTKAEALVKEIEMKMDVLKNLRIGFDTEQAMFDLDSLMQKFEEQIGAGLTIPITPQQSGSATPSITDTVQKNAYGGLITGEGGPTDDKILSWLSNGEFVVKASSVASLGRDALEYINRFGRLPKFSTGGFISSVRNQAALPSLNLLDKLQVPSLGPSMASGHQALQPVILNLPGGDSFNLSGGPDVVAGLMRAVRRERLKRGS